MFSLSFASAQQAAGSIRGQVYDRDFDVPLVGARVTLAETGQSVLTSDQGNFVLAQIPPGKYTLVFAKDGYVRQVKADVLVTAGQLTDVDVALAGEFTEMDEFVVKDLLQLGGGTELGLLQLRFESPSFMDSIGSDLMSRAGASDAASALRLVSGASLQEGKFAVVRGLPDRYVSSQLNGVRLPSADEDTRAVELDQYPAAVIESIQVTKTFTPDQQGDASGGAVNVGLKSIPDETILQFKSQIGYKTQVTGQSNFLSYDGGGLNFFGDDDRDIQYENLGDSWDGAVGVSRTDAPVDSKWSAAVGGKHELDNDVKLGGFASVFYERESSFHDNGQEDSWWVTSPGAGMSPETSQGAPKPGGGGDFKTSLLDLTEGSQSVQWGGLGAVGVESENHFLGLTFLYTRSTEDKATLAEDTRGKEWFYPGYDPNDPMGPGNMSPGTAPYLRTETLEYTERTTRSLQLNGRHKLPIEEFGSEDSFMFRAPELSWTASRSAAKADQPDKRQFGALWRAPYFQPFFGTITPPEWLPYAPDANFNLGNVQRIWTTVEEDSEQYSLNLKLPFTQWSDEEGYLKTGLFDDRVKRKFDRDSFSNFGDAGISFIGEWDEFWSEHFPFEDHAITESLEDVDYDGDLRISAWYTMLDLPLSAEVSVIGGARFESTEISTTMDPERDAVWFPPGEDAPTQLNPGDGDVDYDQDDVLPSIGLVYEPTEKLTLRVAYSETVARQTFKELTPIPLSEFSGGEVFIGNPALTMSALKNYDFRADYVPYEGGLVSASYFRKDIKDPIEYVQEVNTSYTYTSAVNYPEGELSGVELEVRQSLNRFSEELRGFSIGANATFISSDVTLPEDDVAEFDGVMAPLSSRDMTNAPEHLYNFYLTYDVEQTGTQLALFYTVQGDTLIAGAGVDAPNFIPSIYAKEYGTLNLSISQQIGKHLKLQFQAKNLTDPTIEEVYRSEYIGDDVRHESYTRGMEFTLGLSGSF